MVFLSSASLRHFWQRAVASVRQHPRWAVGIVAACVALVAVGYFIVYPQLRAQYHWEKAQKAIESHDFLVAVEHLNVCSEVWPSNAETHFLLARTCRRVGEYAVARAYLAKAEQLNWPVEAIDLEYKLIEAQSGNVRRVERALIHHLQAGHHEEVQILEALVDGYVSLRYVDDIVRWSDVWIYKYPNDWRPFAARATAMEFENIPSKDNLAIRDYERVLELKPDHWGIRWRLGELLRRQGRYGEALPHLRLCHQQDPDDPNYVLALSRCLLSSGGQRQAREVLARWLDQHTDQNAQIFFARGLVELDLDQPEVAMHWLQKAEKINPRDEETLTTLAHVLRQFGQQEKSQDYARKAKDIHNLVEKLRIVLRRARANPEDASLRSEAGQTLLQLGREQDGLHWLSAALTLDANHSPTHRALGDYYLSRGDLERARNHYQRAKRAEGATPAPGSGP